jgi:hypothetical protein
MSGLYGVHNLDTWKMVKHHSVTEVAKQEIKDHINCMWSDSILHKLWNVNLQSSSSKF